MISRFESFSTEVFYEIFDCLLSYDIFYGLRTLARSTFARQTDARRTLARATRAANTQFSYPLELDFRKISRSKFDFICHHLHPEQVISLIFSDKEMPKQVILFDRSFPHFKQQFIHLRSIKFIKTEDILSNLPSSISSLTFEECDSYAYKIIINTIIQQAKSLTYLKINRIDILQLINTPFPFLTYLNINRGVLSVIDCILQRYETTFIDFQLFIQNLCSPITHLKIVIDQENLRKNKSLFYFEYLSSSLTHVTLICHIEINMSLELFQQCFIKLLNLKYLTITAIGGLDLIDGKQWEKFIRQTKIIKFNFKFTLSRNVNFEQDKSILLQPFRSAFWLEEKHWYVACSKPCWNRYTQLSVYSIPRFLSRCVNYVGIHDYPPLSTVPLAVEQQIFYSKYIHHLSLDFNKLITPSIHRFTHVNLLILAGSTLPSMDILMSIVDLSQIKTLDISCIKNISIGQIHLLLEYTYRLSHLIIENFIPLFIPPLHIHSLTVKKWKYGTDIDKFCSIFSHIKSLNLDIELTEMMVKLINRLKNLEYVVFWYNIDKYLPFISMRWLRRTVYRLRRKKFTYQAEEFYLLLSIDNKRTINNRH